MRRSKTIAWTAGVLLASAAHAAGAAEARFDWFSYAGEDGAAVPVGSYRNPVLAGFYPDPSIVAVGQDYYLVNSTFSWFPGIPVFHSRDLVHWRQIGNAIDRPGQLDFTGISMSSGVFAPAISWHDGVFEIVNTCVRCGGNFVVTARDPAGPWSDPVWIRGLDDAIDPSLFRTANGDLWLVNNGPPSGTPRYSGHRAIWLHRLDPRTYQMVGDPVLLVDGGVDPAKNPVWIEGPHLIEKDGWFYLIAAEGGTSVNHSQVVLRAAKVDGPYVPAPAGVNPILTQRDLPETRPDPVTSTGHADFVKLPDGRWQAVFLGTRPYEGNHYNTGRETFLLPVTWKDGWPSILPPGRPVPRIAPGPLAATDVHAPPQTGTFSYRDEFAAPLGLAWMSPRGPRPAVRAGQLVLAPGDGIGSQGKPAFAARRQQHMTMTAETRLATLPGPGEAAGLVAWQNEGFYLSIAVERRGAGYVVRAARRASPEEPASGRTLAEARVPARPGIAFRIAARGARYDLSYRMGKGGWTVLAPGADGRAISTETAGGFVGAMIGPFAEKR